MYKLLLIAVSSTVLLQGCATHDRRDTPWDPPKGRILFEQLPAWDGSAQRVCCGHLRVCQPGQSPRC